MPTPLAHGVAGLAVARTVRSDWKAWHFALVAFVITLIPDLDFIPGVLAGDPGSFHRGATHSLFGAVVLSVPIATLLALAAHDSGADRPGRLARFRIWYSFVLPVYLSHLFLDLVSADTVNNSGLQLGWPFTNAYSSAPMPMPASIRPFFDLEFGPDANGFFATLFSGHALAVYFVEALIFSPLLLLPVLAIRLRRRAKADKPASRNRRGPAREPRQPEPAGGNAA